MSRFSRILQTGGPIFGLVLVCALFALTEEREFIFTGGNLKNILTQTVIVAIGALGMTLIIIGGGIDLSVGSVVAFTGVLGAKLLVAGWSPVATACVLVASGCAIGLFNGAIVARFRIVPFIVTLGMMGIVRGSAKWLGNNQTINAPENSPSAYSWRGRIQANSGRCPGRVDRPRPRRGHGGAPSQDGLRPARLRHRLERNRFALQWRAGGTHEALDLRHRRSVVRLRRPAPDVAPDPRRSHCGRRGWNSTSSPPSSLAARA